MVAQFDLVIIQRCYILETVFKIAKVCEFLGKPFIFETDDDYENLLPSNPAYFAVCDDQQLFRQFYEAQKAGKNDEAKEFVPQLMESRQRGLENYKKLLALPDYVTVSTEELKRMVYKYNKNVVVFENNIDRLFPWKDHLDLKNFLIPTEQEHYYEIQKGVEVMKFYMTPNHLNNNGTITHMPRIGYTGTPSHRNEDFETIREPLNQFSRQNKENHFFTMIGDPYFYNALEDKSRAFYIEGSQQYEKYMLNVRNIDIMLCPLFPCIFNMSKSDIKLVEAAAWRTPGLAPRFVTYSRNFKDEETCLMYSNGDEFIYQLERLVKDHKLRKTLGDNAFTYVKENRMESQHAEKRYNFYKSVIEGKKPLSIFKPTSSMTNHALETTNV